MQHKNSVVGSRIDLDTGHLMMDALTNIKPSSVASSSEESGGEGDDSLMMGGSSAPGLGIRALAVMLRPGYTGRAAIFRTAFPLMNGSKPSLEPFCPSLWRC